jgi:hypothetical protein
MKAPLEVHEAPDLAAVHPQVGLHVGRRLVHSGKLNSQELGAPLQRGCHRPGEGRGKTRKVHGYTHLPPAVLMDGGGAEKPNVASGFQLQRRRKDLARGL